MDKDTSSSSTPRKGKGRFKPRAQPRRPQNPNPEGEDAETKAERERQALIRRFQENQARRTGERKSADVEVAFGPGAQSSGKLRTFGVPKLGNPDQDSSLGLQGYDDDDDDDEDMVLSPTPLASYRSGTDAPMAIDTEDASNSNVKNPYVEIWDYGNSKYPTSLPLREPYSGDPDILNEKEFVEDAEKEYDETTINTALELGLLESNAKKSLFFLQLPPTLPILKQSTSAKGKEKFGSSTPSEKVGAAKNAGDMEALPSGQMGKMLIYRSGAVKMKIGNVLYDVSPGSNCAFAQDVAAIDTKLKKCCILGEVGKRVVLTPDVDSLLDSVVDKDRGCVSKNHGTVAMCKHRHVNSD